MSTELIMPKAGLTNTEGTLGSWKAKEGELVRKGQDILEIENEKVTMDYNSPADGILHILAKTGDEIPVGQVMGYIADNQAEYEELCAGNGVSAARQGDCKAENPPEAEKASACEAGKASACESGRGRLRVSPLARKLAAEGGADLTQICGTGPGGRIVAKDVTQWLLCGKAPDSGEAVSCGAPKGGREPVRRPMTPMRRAIATRMYDSLRSMAQTSDFVEVDVTQLTELRGRLAAQEEKLGTRITVGDLLSRAVVKMLGAHPLGNASLDGDEIITYPYVNLSMAVATDYGLTSPVVKDADLMSLTQLSLALKDVVRRGRENRLTAEELSGGTVTITNMGIFPVDCFNPIVNPPQSLIVGFGRAAEKPAVYRGEIVARTMMWLSVTYDHRVFDGSEIGAIMRDLKEYMENPELILL